MTMTPSHKPGQPEPEDLIHGSARDQANLCRRLAHSINDRETAALLERMAEDYDRGAIGSS